MFVVDSFERRSDLSKRARLFWVWTELLVASLRSRRAAGRGDCRWSPPRARRKDNPSGGCWATNRVDRVGV